MILPPRLLATLASDADAVLARHNDGRREAREDAVVDHPDGALQLLGGKGRDETGWNGMKCSNRQEGRDGPG